MTGPAGAWSRYWQEAATAGDGATLADLPAQTRQRLDAPWIKLAAALPHRSRVLDLATGGGVVLAVLQRHRPNLVLTGVDSAAALPKRKGMILKGGISTDRLPFRDASFAAVTSRFGIEYGSLAQGAAEAARVTEPGGRICFVIHHADSPIVRHNRDRAKALHWIARQSGWVEKAGNLVRARATAALPTPASFRAVAQNASALFPGQVVIGEFMAGLTQLLDAGLGRPGIHLPPLEALVARADDELARLTTLLGAACDVERLTQLRNALANGGIDLAEPTTISEFQNGEPLAWLIEGRRV